MGKYRKDEKEQEFTRSMKHLLIRALLRYQLLIFEIIGPKQGVDLIVSDWVNGELKSVGMTVRTSAITDSGGSWRYTITVPPRSQYPEDPNFLWALVFEDSDELRPSIFILTSIQLKTYIESKLKKLESWKEDEPYAFHPTRDELKKVLSQYTGFKVIDSLLGRPKPEPYTRSSEKYWEQQNWLDS